MICIQCGAQNDETISYCRQCGMNMQAIRSALLGVPPAQQQLSQPLMHSNKAPLVLITAAVFGFLSFGALFGAIIAIIAIGSEQGVRIDPGSFVFLASLVAIVGTFGIVMLIRTLLKAASSMTVAPPAGDAGNRTLPPQRGNAALPPVREPISVVENTTAHLQNYVRPARNTGE